MHPKIKYELLGLEQFLDLRIPVISDGIADKKSSSEQSIRTEVDRIKQIFIHEVFTFEDERHLERYIQYHQQELIRLMDQTLGYLQADEIKHNSRNLFYQLLYSGLEELLTCIERHFAKYLDQDAKAPEQYITIIRNDVHKNLVKLQRMLTEREADLQLTDTIIHAVRKIVDVRSPNNSTYRKVLYAKEIQKELFRLLDGNHEIPDVNEGLRLIMYYLNYNSNESFHYQTQYIGSVVKDVETRTEKIEKLSLLLKKVNQAQIKPGFGYNPNAPLLKEQVSSYIAEEIDYLQRVHHLTSPSTRLVDPVHQNFRLKFEMSVSQLAYLVRIFIESNFIQNKNLAEILRFLCKVAMTKRSESISYESLRVKFYNVEKGTQESVKSMLLSMVRYIDKQ